MALEIQRDPRLRAVPWRDLRAISRGEMLSELLLPLPWLFGSFAFAHVGLWPPALAASFVFFLCGSAWSTTRSTARSA